MKVGISALGENLEAQMDPRFGRCKYFIIVDTDTMEFEASENKNAMAMGGAGIQTSQTIIDKGAEAVISGHFGPNAFRTLKAGNVKAYTCPPGGSVKEAIEQFKQGKLKEMSGPAK